MNLLFYLLNNIWEAAQLCTYAPWWQFRVF